VNHGSGGLERQSEHSTYTQKRCTPTYIRPMGVEHLLRIVHAQPGLQRIYPRRHLDPDGRVIPGSVIPLSSFGEVLPVPRHPALSQRRVTSGHQTDTDRQFTPPRGTLSGRQHPQRGASLKAPPRPRHNKDYAEGRHPTGPIGRSITHIIPTRPTHSRPRNPDSSSTQFSQRISTTGTSYQSGLTTPRTRRSPFRYWKRSAAQGRKFGF
jgi:hypothetical protein